MDKKDIIKICIERFGKWTETLVEQNATPIIGLGMGVGERSGTIHVLTLEDMPDETIAAFLVGAAKQIGTNCAILPTEGFNHMSDMLYLLAVLVERAGGEIVIPDPKTKQRGTGGLIIVPDYDAKTVTIKMVEAPPGAVPGTFDRIYLGPKG